MSDLLQSVAGTVLAAGIYGTGWHIAGWLVARITK